MNARNRTMSVRRYGQLRLRVTITATTLLIHPRRSRVLHSIARSHERKARSRTPTLVRAGFPTPSMYVFQRRFTPLVVPCPLDQSSELADDIILRPSDLTRLRVVQTKLSPAYDMLVRGSEMKPFTVHTDCLFDSKKKAFVTDTSIVIDPTTGLITKVYERREPVPDNVKAPDVDLRGKCVLPGLVDAHTHIFLHAYSETPALNQMRDESSVERIVRATNHARVALLAGFTTYRDLGTESLGDADAHFRDAINRGIIPGPRIYCVTEALASSGGYEIRQENQTGGTTVPRISDPCDGITRCRAAVRRRLGAGADLIKFYADYRKRALRFPESAWPGCPGIQFPPSQRGPSGERNPNLLLFGQDEMDAIVAEAKTARAPVAAHASTAEGVAMAARAGVTTVEHGFESFEGSEAIDCMRANGTIFVPTLAVCELFLDVEPVLKQVKKVFDQGVKLACGGDTGAFAHGENARELELMLQAGVPLEDVLAAATLHGWEACGGDWCGRKFGWVGEGWAADLVALRDDVRRDVGALRRVDFVMKDGRVYKDELQRIAP